MYPGEAAKVLNISVKTLGHWAQLGYVGYVKTPGGHKRYKKADVLKLAELNDFSGTPDKFVS